MLYTVDEAKAITLPNGWRLPTSDDYTKLLTFVGSDPKKLMSKTGWANNIGTNTSGFNAFPSGDYDHDQYSDRGTDAVFITSSTLVEHPGVPASFNIYEDQGTNDAIITDIVNTATDRGSLRFVKDN